MAGGTTTGGTVVTTGGTVVTTGDTVVDVDDEDEDEDEDELDTSASTSDSFKTLIDATAKTMTQLTGMNQSNPDPILYQFFAMCGTIRIRNLLLTRNRDDEYQQLHLGCYPLCNTILVATSGRDGTRTRDPYHVEVVL